MSRVQRLAGPAVGQRPFVPVGDTNRDKRGAFYPGWWLQPGQKAPFLSRLVSPTGTKGPHSLLSRLDPPTGIKSPSFVSVGVSNRDKRPLSPLLVRLAVGPGTKATYCPGPKGCRDKWPGTKACFVVVKGLAVRLVGLFCFFRGKLASLLFSLLGTELYIRALVIEFGKPRFIPD